jgi:hypothetical protein
MDTDDDLFLEMIESVTLDVPGRIGDDPEARYAFFKRFLPLAQAVVGDAGKCR